MNIKLQAIVESFPIAGKFVISRGSKTEANVVRVVLEDGHHAGTGECVPYARYGESVESVLSQIEAARSSIESGLTIESLQIQMPAGAARNAIDCALWDLAAKRSGIAAFISAGYPHLKPVTTAYTLSLGTPDEMAAAAKASAHRPLLKIKVGGADDMERLRAVAMSAPNSRIIVDANEGWSEQNVEENLHLAASLGVVLIEQPLPAGQDSILSKIAHPVAICADESVHQSADLASLADRYDAVNIKLDKSGGLTEAIKMHRLARQTGMKIMVGCMVGTSLAMAPALILAQDADFVDLDGPLLLARDREPGLIYNGSIVSPPTTALWG